MLSWAGAMGMARSAERLPNVVIIFTDDLGMPAIWTALEVHTDLQAGRYLAMGMFSEYAAPEFGIKRTLEDYTPAALRREGVR